MCDCPHTFLHFCFMWHVTSECEKPHYWRCQGASCSELKDCSLALTFLCLCTVRRWGRTRMANCLGNHWWIYAEKLSGVTLGTNTRSSAPAGLITLYVPHWSPAAIWVYDPWSTWSDSEKVFCVALFSVLQRNNSKITDFWDPSGYVKTLQVAKGLCQKEELKERLDLKRFWRPEW